MLQGVHCRPHQCKGSRPCLLFCLHCCQVRCTRALLQAESRDRTAACGWGLHDEGAHHGSYMNPQLAPDHGLHISLHLRLCEVWK